MNKESAIFADFASDRYSKKSERVPAEREKLKEQIFSSIVFDRLVSRYEGLMVDLDFSEEDIDEYKRKLTLLGEEDEKRVLAIPYELQKTFFSKMKARVDTGEITVGEAIDALNLFAQEKGYTMGYHASKYDIQKTNNAGRETWSIQATEVDDRDDMKMAYYSLDYSHVFRKRHPRYMYVVRAEMGDSTAHKKDLSNNWGRAASLSVVERFDIREIDMLVDNELRNNIDKKKQATNDIS